VARIPTADVVICGAGIAGVSLAHELACRRGVRDVVLVDPEPPLCVTSDKSTECYRNWWPGPGDAMVRLMNRSIDLLEELAGETGDAFSLHPAGYAYFTATAEGARALQAEAREVAALGGGELHVHGGGDSAPPPPPPPSPSTPSAGPRRADLLLGGDLVRRRFPAVGAEVRAALLVGRAGWLSAQQLGMALLERAREAGVRLVRGRVTRVRIEGDRVAGVELAGVDRPGADLAGPAASIATRRFVDAAGPAVAEVARLLGVELPVHHELHAKVTFDDHLGVVPRDLPLMIWNDPQRLAWSDEERRDLAGDPGLAWLLQELPGGAHLRPEGGAGSRAVLMLWAYRTPPVEPVFPPAFDELYAQVALRGLVTMLPGLAPYLDRARRPYVDGGYYTRTAENRPLVGPLGPRGGFVVGALSGFGIMASQGAAELAARHLTGDALPPYADAFRLERYADPAYRRLLESAGGARGQL
jgi:sarcosine oxidase, subunit beta